jgi:hypothetical protein
LGIKTASGNLVSPPSAYTLNGNNVPAYSVFVNSPNFQDWEHWAINVDPSGGLSLQNKATTGYLSVRDANEAWNNLPGGLLWTTDNGAGRPAGNDGYESLSFEVLTAQVATGAAGSVAAGIGGITPTPNSYTSTKKMENYDFSNPTWKLPELGAGIIQFKAATNPADNILVAFSDTSAPSALGDTTPRYEFIYGGWSNRQGVIRRANDNQQPPVQGSLKVINTNCIIPDTNPHDYWIIIDKYSNTVSMGSGTVPGQAAADTITWTDPAFLTAMQYFSLCSFENTVQYSNIRISGIFKPVAVPASTTIVKVSIGCHDKDQEAFCLGADNNIYKYKVGEMGNPWTAFAAMDLSGTSLTFKDVAIGQDGDLFAITNAGIPCRYHWTAPTTTTTPAATTPAKTTPAKTTPAKTTPAKTTPAKTTPAKTTPAKTTPTGGGTKK